MPYFCTQSVSACLALLTDVCCQYGYHTFKLAALNCDILWVIHFQHGAETMCSCVLTGDSGLFLITGLLLWVTANKRLEIGLYIELQINLNASPGT